MTARRPLKAAVRLVITHDGVTVFNRDVARHVEITVALERNRPPAARGSVAQLHDMSVPARHPRRLTTIALSGHSTHGPVWTPLVPLNTGA